MIGQKLSRNYINRQIKRIVSVFRWGVENEFVDPATHQRLGAVRGLRKGEAGETEKVVPVTQAQVDAVRPHLPRDVEALMDLQWLTGARSGELLKLRPVDLQTGEDTWTYSPAEHKTAHHGEQRIIEFGPKAQAILREFMARRPMDARLFDSHDRNSYRIAIARACDKAFPPPERLARLRVSAGGRKKLRRETRQEWQKRLGPDAWAEVQGWKERHRWHPHQLRHAFATRVRSLAGLENARVATGHKTTNMTEHYAKPERAAVTALLTKIG
jgi:integrase